MKYIVALFALFFLQTTSDDKQRIFLIGDSTMSNKKAMDAPETGWGQVFHEVFTEAVEIHNYAVNGRSTKSFRETGQWQFVLDQLAKDDYVLIQFGHNDAKADDPSRYAPAQTDYRQNLIRYIQEIRSKGAIPLLITPVSRRNFDADGKFQDTHADYPSVVKEVGKKERVDVIDLHIASRKLIESLGPDVSENLFMHYPGGIYPKFPDGIRDNTHFSAYGARVMAQCVANELNTVRHGIAKFFKKSVYPEKYEFELPIIYEPVFRKDTFNILSYGAKSDATFDNSGAIAQAIQMANSKGGGVVLIPPGLWVSGPIELLDNINLHIAEGALIKMTEDRKAYPIIETSWEGQNAFRCQAPVGAYRKSNIAITGKGVLDGSGHLWKTVKKSKLTETQWKRLTDSGGMVKDNTWYPSESSYLGHHSDWAKKISEGKTMKDYETVRDYLRPNMISFRECNNILISDVTFQNSPAWTIHPLMCKHITVKSVNVKNPWFGQNNDAIDLESCRYGIMDGCTFDTGDDAITIKSGRDAEGRKRGIPTENIIIKNTTVFHGHGGFVIGSEMSGGVHNMFVHNCIFMGTDIGLRFKTTRGRGGSVDNIFISDIFMTDIVGEAILFDMYYAAQDPVMLVGDKKAYAHKEKMPVNEGTPSFSEFYMENVHCIGAKSAMTINGLPEMNTKNISLKNASFKTETAFQINDADGIELHHVSVSHTQGPLVWIHNSKNVRFSEFKSGKTGSDTIHIHGSETKGIHLNAIQNGFNPELIRIQPEVNSSGIKI